jgi:enediyne biosynthesis protein E5
MIQPIIAPALPPAVPRKSLAILDSRYLPPIFITCILLAGNLSFGMLESYQKTLLAIVTSIVTEMVLGRLLLGKWPHPASAYITGISVGILVRSPAFWPYALCSAISITSKYVLRVKDRHIWNPSNFGISVMLFLVPEAVATLSIQWGNYLLPLLVIWVLGCVIVWRVHRLHITATYVVSFLAFAFLRSWRTDVSALHLLYGYRPENHGAKQDGTMHHRILGSSGGDGDASASNCLCAFLCALSRRSSRLAH